MPNPRAPFSFPFLVIFFVLPLIISPNGGYVRFAEGGKRRVHITDDLDDVVDDEEDETWKEWGKKSTPSTDFDPPPNDLSKMDLSEIDHLDQAMAESENAKREAFEEALRRGKAEKDAIDAIRRAKASEYLYNEELRQRKETEDILEKEREELEKMKRQRDEVMGELRAALDRSKVVNYVDVDLLNLFCY